MTSQNEKDRQQIEALRLFMDMNDTQKVLFEIADRLLAEREKAELVYQQEVEITEPFSDESGSEKEISLVFEYTGCNHDFLSSPTTKKGIWIPVEEDE
ncbi:hypothetical protein HB884_05135 [Listeria booriae]|uniref:hypothetical protein n=1 Tax=Listeria booriae TaxID=1552123 RepID=UPI001623AEBB|nr:hypothetical protein [Listeria booriae]MBC1523589.1 hypothetical protein [Listeria booriae]